ncbi:hypothetical protein [Acidocella aminolytica]|jgi:hypothetical protein|uniref:Uncharacterized protein n=1 Tax=Acidocella aminolytica 101 = DSM 11237 TaxID=1120923 RepID=A0A0D6PKN9_9PROT|nr:hypothetical protein [Acidocella aminolytica]GAN81768.1 hypothetical protein Aam_118_010 [Acidocella aminolytica 101 = DSM 11237]GBQ37665.1 hypothetical protein AA11237_1612 [Acidocella aminolytica 101 = DSM 11237]SHE52444.1 hypothetical protein SAMN02746095_00659 [Acidocella aminolytica 101 = DSM 11237]
MNIKNFSEKNGDSGPHAPHGLSREPPHTVAVPVILGIVCMVVVFGVLWVAYTYG